MEQRTRLQAIFACADQCFFFTPTAKKNRISGPTCPWPSFRSVPHLWLTGSVDHAVGSSWPWGQPRRWPWRKLSWAESSGRGPLCNGRCPGIFSPRWFWSVDRRRSDVSSCGWFHSCPSRDGRTRESGDAEVYSQQRNILFTRWEGAEWVSQLAHFPLPWRKR